MLISEKLSIVSRRPQTTRHRILGVLNQPGLQIAFYDTPGFQYKFRRKMNVVMNRTVKNCIGNANVVLLIIDALKWDFSDLKQLEGVSDRVNVFLVINKIDVMENKNLILPFIDSVKTRYNFSEIVPISALRNNGVKSLINAIANYLDTGEPMFDINFKTNRDKTFYIREFIREKLYLFLGEEIPYKCGVIVEKIDEFDKLSKIKVNIIVDQKNHKGIVVGKNGEMLKKIVSSARLSIEKKFLKKIFLEVWVKVHAGWVDSDANLRDLMS